MSVSSTFGSTRFRAGGVVPQSLGIPAAAYPGRVATNSDLIVAVDRQQTRLALPLNATDTSMTVVDPSVVVAYNLLSIDNEIVKTTGAPAGNVVPIQRGFDGTTPVIHLASATVSGFIDAYHHNGLVAEIEAIEQALGPNLSHLPTSPFVVSTAFQFAPQTPGGTLTSGNQVVTLSPVPPGVNGTDQNHYLYISGGTGTAEAVLITGGTAIAGAPSGTVIVNCANAHSGAWTIQTATGGIQEAISSVACGIVLIPSGTFTLYAQVTVKSNMTLQGFGIGCTTLQVGANLWPPSNSGPFYSPAAALPMALTSVNNAVNVGMRDFTVDQNGQNQVNTTYGCIVGVVNGSYCTIERLSVINAGNQGIAIGGLRLGGSTPTRFKVLNCQVHGMGGSPGVHTGGIFTQIYNSFIGWNYTENLPDMHLTPNSITNCTFIGNYCQGHAGNTATAAGQEDSQHTQWIGNTFQGCFGIVFSALASSAPINDYVMIGNAIVADATGGATTGLFLHPSAQAMNDITIANNLFSTSVTTGNAIDISATLSNKGYVITGNTIRGWGNGIVATGSRNLAIAQNIIKNQAGAGILAQTATTNVSIRDNIMSNNAGGNVLTAGATGIIATPNLTDDAYSMVSTLSAQLTLANGANQNINIGGNGQFATDMYVEIVGPTAAFSVGGFNGGFAGKRLTVMNFTSQAMTINNMDAGSAAANQIYTFAGNVAGTVATLIYDSSGSVWRLTAVR